MAYRQLWIFVEGSDDVRFINTVVRPNIDDLFDAVRVIEYAQMKKEKLYAYIHSINAIPDSDYLFLADINSSPCITFKKQNIHEKFKQRISCNKSIIVVKAIESWYLAGLDDNRCNDFGITPFSYTNDITKEQFNSLVPRNFKSSRDDFMIEILKSYSIEIAKSKNSSFNYFVSKTF